MPKCHSWGLRRCRLSVIVPRDAELEKAGMHAASPGTRGWAPEQSSALEQWDEGPLGGSRRPSRKLCDHRDQEAGQDLIAGTAAGSTGPGLKCIGRSV